MKTQCKGKQKNENNFFFLPFYDVHLVRAGMYKFRCVMTVHVTKFSAMHSRRSLFMNVASTFVFCTWVCVAVFTAADCYFEMCMLRACGRSQSCIVLNKVRRNGITKVSMDIALLMITYHIFAGRTCAENLYKKWSCGINTNFAFMCSFTATSLVLL